jgi:hypothetical protein
MKPYTFDIETVPQRPYWAGEEYAVDWYWLRTERENFLADGGNEEQWEEESPSRVLTACQKHEAPLASTGQIPACHPTTAHIVSISSGMLGEQGNIQVDTAQLDDFARGPLAAIPDIEAAEKEVLRRGWQLLSWARDRRLTLVSFNGKGFDLPMMRWRSTLLGVAVPKLKWYELLYPFRNVEHVDIRLLLSDGDKRAKGTLAMWCEAFGLEAEESGHKVLEWAQAGDWGEIRRYGGVEMASLIELFTRVQGAI